ncbi:putative ubiquitin carboxyl-terminal hydrolase [Rosellinia necatrix]|uniref:ubiquitinyl hydrolase 1 n=1 Tax=Rosellinia necatrix TaxID=77044 RepID=A0A1W2TLC5_ROSNE|nr:putative ubiquitin carboxyl-terminal hydrolase [Rosellinia necatrix]
MKPGGLPKKFLSRREKNGHRHGKSSDGVQKHHLPITTDIFSFFKFDGAKHHAKDEDEVTREEKEGPKVEEVRQKAASIGFDLHGLDDSHILYALRLKYSSMEVDKAIEILELQQASLSGEIFSYNPNTRMLGAENRGNVTCYLDALLFAMFAKLDAFECMLKADTSDEPRKKLVALLRLWVNMLRSGKLIEVDMTEHIQEALAGCGWAEARYLEQQDTSEAFAFITETLQLPLLTLQVDLFHQGKNDDADHKVVYERLLNLAVPPDSEGKGIKLEDCLEEYFNSRVDVHREGFDEKKASDGLDRFSNPSSPNSPITPRSTIHVVEIEDARAGASAEAFDDSKLQARRQSNSSAPDIQVSGIPLQPGLQPSGSIAPWDSQPRRSRTESIIQRVVIDRREQASDTDTAGLFQRAKKKASVVKAVTIPAWQFFKLIPWHSPANSNPQSDLEVARHFSQRPVVGICLKRYMMDKNGTPKRQNTYIDIPDSLRLPHFIVDDRHVEEGGLTAEYKLVLQSVVCHRGDSLHSGHYISFCRVAPKLLTNNRRHEKDPPPDYEEAQWVKFDDLASERVTAIDDIKESLKQEMPYLLFYQIVPIVGVAPSSVGSIEAGPPAYDDGTPVPIATDAPGYQEYHMVSRKNSGYFENSNGLPSAAPSVRFSAELEPPTRHSFADEDGFLSTSRRDSIAYGDLMTSGSSTASNDHSLAASPGEETTAQRLSRAAARFKPSSKSRPHSQGGETRISQTMSKLGLMKSSREPLRESAHEIRDEDTDVIVINGAPNGQGEKERTPRPYSRGKEKEATQKRGKSKTPFDKGKTKDKDVPDRECIVQ